MHAKQVICHQAMHHQRSDVAYVSNVNFNVEKFLGAEETSVLAGISIASELCIVFIQETTSPQRSDLRTRTTLWFLIVQLECNGSSTQLCGNTLTAPHRDLKTFEVISWPLTLFSQLFPISPHIQTGICVSLTLPTFNLGFVLSFDLPISTILLFQWRLLEFLSFLGLVILFKITLSGELLSLPVSLCTALLGTRFVAQGSHF